jgi:hypothetical protein
MAAALPSLQRGSAPSQRQRAIAQIVVDVSAISRDHDYQFLAKIGGARLFLRRVNSPPRRQNTAAPQRANRLALGPAVL